MSLAKRLADVSTVMIDHQIAQALAKARSGPRAAFARVLLAGLPGTPTHVWIYLALLRDDELQLLAEESR